MRVQKMSLNIIGAFLRKCKKVKIEVTVPKETTIFHRFWRNRQIILFPAN